MKQTSSTNVVCGCTACISTLLKEIASLDVLTFQLIAFSITFTTHKMYEEHVKIKCLFIPTVEFSLLLKHFMKRIEQ